MQFLENTQVEGRKDESTKGWKDRKRERQKDGRIQGRKDGRTEGQALFHRTFPTSTGGQKTDHSNYRPISVLSIISKVISTS